MEADSTTGTATCPKDDTPMIPAAAPDNTAVDKSTFFPFLRLPFELRSMVYRVLLVSGHRIHLECILAKQADCLHRLVVHTPLLRVCHQISTEALNVLYGQNDFVCEGDCLPSSVVQHFSPENQLRLRMIILTHYCCLRGVDFDPDYLADRDWGLDFDSDYETDSIVEDVNDNFRSGERLITPGPVWHLEARVWRPIFANLTRFTITLIIDCCDWDESIISQDEEFK
jgi:hypothetical protein